MSPIGGRPRRRCVWARNGSNLALRAGDIGIFDIDIVSGTVTWTERQYPHFGLDPSSFGATTEAFLDRVHPDDREDFSRAFTAAREPAVGVRAPIPDRAARWPRALAGR